ncbi:MAG: hypothetical protein AAB846_02730 [Patescibacteria group bacterium]
MAEEEKKLTSDIPSIRTLKTDAEAFSSDKNISFIQAAAAELERQQKMGVGERLARAKKPLAFLLAGLALVSAVGGGAYYYMQSRRAPPEEIFLRETIVPGDLEETITLRQNTRSELLGEAGKKFFDPLAEREIRTLAFAVGEGKEKRTLKSGGIIALSELAMPSRLRADIHTLQLGSVRKNGIAPFLILKVRSHADALAAMLEWEKSLARDIGIFFPGTRDFSLIGARFEDKIIQNQDARVLAKEGKSILAYAFFNQTTLVIAASDTGLDALLERLQKR